MKKCLILVVLVCTVPSWGMSVGAAVVKGTKVSAKATYRASKNLALAPFRALRHAGHYLNRAGDGSPIPTCIPGHPCDDKDELRKS